METYSKVDTSENVHETDAALHDPVVIVGMAMRLPGNVSNEDDFWDMLVNGRSGIGTIPTNRFSAAGYHSTQPKAGTIPTRLGYFLEHIDLDRFDASHFPFTRKEVESMDPCQRQLLEITWECLENAGEIKWQGKDIGCYVGSFVEDRAWEKSRDSQYSSSYPGGRLDIMLANRVSYAFDFRGPSMVVRTGCSATLVGLHLAAEAVRHDECSGAVVLGCNLIASGLNSAVVGSLGILSSTGSCRTFDAESDGYGRGEAISAIFVKRLSSAIKDGNPIRAIVRGTATQHAGLNPGGMFTPSLPAQEALIRRTYELAGISDYSQTAFFECHGTGTRVGDPIEMGAVARVFGNKGVLIGGVKPNVGHSEGAAGLSSIIKSVLMLEKGIIVPNINLRTPNPQIPWEDAHLSVPKTPVSFPSDCLRRVSINGFGIAGSNGHVVLDAYMRNQANSPTPSILGYHLLVFSCSNPQSLRKQFETHMNYIHEKSPTLEDLAYTLACRREKLKYGAFALLTDQRRVVATDYHPSSLKKPHLIYVFTGQGAQWPMMGKRLLETNATFQNSIRRLDLALQNLAEPPSWKIEAELMRPKESSRIMNCEFSVPCSTAVQIGLVELLRQWTVLPQAVIGHSSGEIAAAYAAGALSARDAIITAYLRGQVCSSQVELNGIMAAVGLGSEQIERFLTAGTVVACENSDVSTTISGGKEAVEKTIRSIKEVIPEAFIRILPVDRAYHSPHMEIVGPAYKASLDPLITATNPLVPLYSSVTGERFSDVMDCEYWRRSLIGKVRFRDALETMFKETGGHSRPVLLEIGSHSVLQGPVRHVLDRFAYLDSYYIPTLKRSSDDIESILTMAGRLFCQNIDVELQHIVPLGKVLSNLPTYAWNHEHVYDDSSRIMRRYRDARYPIHELLGRQIFEASDIEPSWRKVLLVDEVPWLKDHLLNGMIVMPLAAYIVMIAEALRQVARGSVESLTIKTLKIDRMLTIQADVPIEIFTRLRPLQNTQPDTRLSFDALISVCQADVWTEICHSTATIDMTRMEVNTSEVVFPTHFSRVVNPEEWYGVLESKGMNFGPSFRRLSSINASTSALAAISSVTSVSSSPEYLWHPTVLDQCIQSMFVARSQGLSRNMVGLLPTYVESISFSACETQFRTIAKVKLLDSGGCIGEACALGRDNSVILHASGVHLDCFGNEANTPEPPILSSCKWRAHADLYEWECLSKFAMEDLSMRDTIGKMLLLVALRLILEYSARSTTDLNTDKTEMVAQLESLATTQPELHSFYSSAIKYDCKEMQSTFEGLLERVGSSDFQHFARFLYAAFLAPGNLSRALLKQELLASETFIRQEEIFLKNVIEISTHTRPRMKILEIGDGNFTRTRYIQDLLHPKIGHQLYSRYVYAVLSSDHLAAAKSELHKPNIEVIHLFNSSDSVFEKSHCGFFDIIVSTNCILETSNVDDRLRQLKALLAPTGILVLPQLAHDASVLNLIDIIYNECSTTCFSVDASPQAAQEVKVDRPQINRNQLAISPISRALLPDPSPHIKIVVSGSISQISMDLAKDLKLYGFQPNISDIENDISQDLMTVFLLDPIEPYLHSATEKQFEVLRQILLRSRKPMIWITPPTQTRCNDPRTAMTFGFIRTLRSECQVDITVVEAKLDVELDRKALSEALVRIIKFLPVRRFDGDIDPDYEFSLVNSDLMVPRLIPTTMQQELFHCAPLSTRKTSTRLTKQKPHHSEVLEWKRYPLDLCRSWEVTVEVDTAAFCEDDITRAKVFGGSSFGYEGAGTVQDVGSYVSSLQVGDRVAFISKGALATSINLNPGACRILDKKEPSHTAAAQPLAYAVAHLAVFNVGRIRAEDKVLLNFSNNIQTLVLIKTLQMVGAEIFFSCDGESDQTTLKSQFNIPENHILFDQRHDSHLAVNFVFFSGGDERPNDQRLMCATGTFIEIITSRSQPRLELTLNGCQAHRILDIEHFCENEPKLLQRSFQEACDKLAFPLNIDTSFAISSFTGDSWKEAFDDMGSMDERERRRTLEISEATKDVATIDRTLVRPRFRPDVFYVLVGGTGGLGRTISRWMVENGARKLVYLSRSGFEASEVASFLHELRSQGCCVKTVAGSVTNPDALRRVRLSVDCSIAGVIQMSVVLRDNSFQSMTYSEWRECIEPKVMGTWNLHQEFQDEQLDFFVLLSSISGLVGQVGQANYSAANAYLDAFVKFRHSIGLPASVVDLGAVRDVGILSRNRTLQDHARAAGYYFLDEGEVLDAISLAIYNSRATSDSTTDFNQIIVGLWTQRALCETSNQVIWKRDARMSMAHVREAGAGIADDQSHNSLVDEIILKAKTNPERLHDPMCIDQIVIALGRGIADILVRPVESLHPDTYLDDLGVDSMNAIELAGWIKNSFLVSIPLFDLTNVTTIQDLAIKLAHLLQEFYKAR